MLEAARGGNEVSTVEVPTLESIQYEQAVTAKKALESDIKANEAKAEFYGALTKLITTEHNGCNLVKALIWRLK